MRTLTIKDGISPAANPGLSMPLRMRCRVRSRRRLEKSSMTGRVSSDQAVRGSDMHKPLLRILCDLSRSGGGAPQATSTCEPGT
jgi:hypothetical protein